MLPRAAHRAARRSESRPRSERQCATPRGAHHGAARRPNGARTCGGVDGEYSFMYRYIPRESCSQFDSLPLTSLTISGARGVLQALALTPGARESRRCGDGRCDALVSRRAGARCRARCAPLPPADAGEGALRPAVFQRHRRQLPEEGRYVRRLGCACAPAAPHPRSRALRRTSALHVRAANATRAPR